jgi:hypothetical protein
MFLPSFEILCIGLFSKIKAIKLDDIIMKPLTMYEVTFGARLARC